jgi:2-isopropylmalate synthase
MTTPEIYDTTLRDGLQQEGLSPTARDRLQLARLIDQLGVDYLEGGWPGASPKDDDFFALAREELDLRHATLVAFGATCRVGADPAEDPQVAGVLAAGTEVVCIVGKTWDYHVREVLRTGLDEGVRMVADSVAYYRAQDRRVFFDAEHAFDGYRDNPVFMLRVLEAAHSAGAERLVLCDTNGGTLPGCSAAVVAEVGAALPDAVLGVHFHNDSGCAVANSLAALEAGAAQVQGCLNGFGERTGNTDLCTLIPNLVLKQGVGSAALQESLPGLGPVAHHIAEITNTAVDPRHPYVGAGAFTHKAGLHTSALARRPDAYEHIDPAAVGNTTRLLVSELMGRSTVLAWAEERGFDLDSDTAGEIAAKVKGLEHAGYLFEAADGSFELLVREALGWEQDFFRVDSFRTLVDERPDGMLAEATVKISVGADRRVITREGDGPVHALDLALHAALIRVYPEVEHIRLTDYRVRDLDSSDGTAARVRVLVEFSNGSESWGVVGVHRNVVAASWEALISGVVIGLLRHRESGRAEITPGALPAAAG